MCLAIIKQLLDEFEHDIMNYQNRGLCYLPKPKAEADNTDTSIITQVIIEILALSLAENSVIFRYNHLRRGDYSGRPNFQNNRLVLCQCVRRVH